MLLNLNLPQINPYMNNAIIDIVHAEVGAAIPVGGKLIDLTIDLSSVAPHDCPPISHYRIVARDHVWLRQLNVVAGDTAEPGAQLALFSTKPDDPLEGPPTRQVRVSIVGISKQQAWPEF